MGRPDNVALRASTALAAGAVAMNIRHQPETGLLNVLTMS